MRMSRVTSLFAVIGAGAAAPLAAQVPAAEQQLGNVQACRAIADIAERVACYDRASAPTPRAARPPVQAPPRPEEQFGHERSQPAPPPPPTLQQQAQTAARELDQITAKIASLRADALGRISFVLDNGQVWRMTESEGVFDFPNRGDTVTIRRGAIGGFRLDWGSIGVRVARAD